jgi:hypothetical protein
LRQGHFLQIINLNEGTNNQIYKCLTAKK